MNPNRYALAIVFFLALAVRFAYTEWRGSWSDAPVLDAGRYDEVGWNLARGNGFRLEGELTAYAPPGYPFFLSIVYRLAGRNAAAARAAQCFAGAAISLFVFLLLQDWRGRRAAWMGGLAAAGYPFILYWTDQLLTETLYLALSVAGLWLTARSVRSAAASAGAGALWGFATLTRPTSLLFPGVVAVWLAVSRRRDLRAAVRPAALFLVFFLIPVGAWTARNAAVFGAFVPVKSAGDASLSFSNNRIVLESARKGEPVWTAPEAPRETAGKNFIRDHPGEWLELEARKFLWFWNFTPMRGSRLELLASGLSMSAVMPLCLWAAFRFRKDPVAWLLLLTVLYFTAMAMLFFPLLRYRAPIEPVLVALAAAGLDALIDRAGAKAGTERRH